MQKNLRFNQVKVTVSKIYSVRKMPSVVQREALAASQEHFGINLLSRKHMKLCQGLSGWGTRTTGCVVENLSALLSAESAVSSAMGRETKMYQYQVYPFSAYQVGASYWASRVLHDRWWKNYRILGDPFFMKKSFSRQILISSINKMRGITCPLGNSFQSVL